MWITFRLLNVDFHWKYSWKTCSLFVQPKSMWNLFSHSNSRKNAFFLMTDFWRTIKLSVQVEIHFHTPDFLSKNENKQCLLCMKLNNKITFSGHRSSSSYNSHSSSSVSRYDSHTSIHPPTQSSMPIHPDVKFIILPFFNVLDVLVKPTSLG